jgi:hypothetical protein
VPDRPVILFQNFNGPCAVNSLAKSFFETVSSPLAGAVAVSPTGAIASGLPSTTALYHLRVRQSFEDKKRSALDAMAFTARVGVTTLLDQTLVAVATGPRDPQPSHPLATLDHYRMYDGWLALHAEGKTFVRCGWRRSACARRRAGATRTPPARSPSSSRWSRPTRPCTQSPSPPASRRA